MLSFTLKILRQLANKYYQVGFFIAIFLFLFISVVTFKQVSQLNNSQKVIQHTYDIKLFTEEILTELITVESGKRAFMLGGDIAFLEPYYYSKNLINKRLALLRALVADNKVQIKNVNQLDSLVTLRYALFDKAINEIVEKKHSKYSIEELEQGRKIMDTTRAKIETIQKLESDLLHQRKQENERLKTNTPIYLLVANLLSLLVILIAFNKINTDYKSSVNLVNKYNLSNQTLLQSQKIGNIGQWTLNLDDWKLEINDEHFKQLGYDNSPGPWTFDEYIQNIHPADRHLLNAELLTDIDMEETRQIIYRLMKNNGEYAYLKTQLKRLQNNEKENLIVSVVIDETTNVNIQNELQKRNESLISLNQELSSFNYIASHDLQEPLRKIQMFISRLKDDDQTQLSEKSTEYFTKINESANRMQNLIKDLLAYSRLHKNQQAFEMVNMNVILERVQEEWAQWIEERDVDLQIGKLPTIYGVPFLMQTLFSNLISNAIKYSKAEGRPEIKVSHKIHTKKGENKEKHQVHHIQVSDNGIGFDNAFAEKIFELFQRLHEKQQYPGTGIGLSICKKIAEVHHGSIYAKSQPGVGSTFILELPVHKA